MEEQNKLLGLNIIVGKGDEKELKRCLESCKGDLFDEIVITQTFEDERVKKVAEEFTENIFFFKWINDFSAARNFSFSKSTTEYILWVDADDVIKPDQYQKLLDFKPQLKNYDMVLVDYVYTHDDKDRPYLVLPRERIVKNCDHIKWHDPVHEYMNMDLAPDKIKRIPVRIDHYRIKPFNPKRNLEILSKVYESGEASPRIKFYYGKELSDSGQWDKSVSILDEYVNEEKDFRDNLTVACIRLSKYYYDKKDYDAAQTYALKGVRFNPIYAENYVTLGTIYELRGDTDTAISYFKEALTKKLEGGMSQLVDFYGFVPSAKLALIYTKNKEYDEALRYCEMALQHKPDNPQMKEIKKSISNEKDRHKGELILKDIDIDKIKGFFEENNFSMEVKNNSFEYADIRLTKSKKLDAVWMIPILDLENPSIRIRRYNVHEKMIKLGVNSQIITNYHGKNVYELRNEIGEANTIIFTQYGELELNLMKHLKSIGKKIIFDHCEALFGYPFENECMQEADYITCCSTKLAEITNKQGFNHTTVLRDAIEDNLASIDRIYEDRYEKPKAVYMGMGGNSWLVNEYLKDTIDKAGYELVTITEWDNADIKWDRNRWPNDLSSCDVVLCPQRVDVQPAKSNVKVTTAMALGMPVLASRIRSYEEVIEDGKNGYICDTFDDWYNALIELKDSNKRRDIGEAAHKSVKRYYLEDITKEWINNLEDLINEKVEINKESVSKPEAKNKNRDLIDIIVLTYNNLEYVKLCLNSIQLNTLHPYHIILSDGGSDKQTWEYFKSLRGITVLGKENDRKSFSETANMGVEASSSNFFVVLNSDVIVSKGWLGNLVDKMTGVNRLAACGVLSNCDRGWLYDNPHKPDLPRYPMKLEESGVDLHPGMKLGEIKPHIEELYNFMDKSNKRYKDKFIQQPWVAVYATIFARSAISEVGIFDTTYKNGCEDLDLCRRLSEFGYVMGQAIGSFVFHFGGISRGAYQEEQKEQYDKEDVENHIKYRKKWDQKRIAIWTGPAYEPWNREKVDEGMAGSETWAAYLSREFVRKGYKTYVYNHLLSKGADEVLDPVEDEKGKVIGNVIYRDYTKMFDTIKYDIIHHFISSRSVDPLRQNLHSLKNYVMIHDVWLSINKEYDVMPWRVDKYGYLSEWHKDFLRGHHPAMPPEKMFLTANGLTPPDAWDDVDSYTKKNQAVYSSSPDRGLFQLLHMLPDIRKEVPDFELVVAYGFYNWEQFVKNRGDDQGKKFLEQVKAMMNQPGVKYVGRVPKKELAHYQKESKVWLYPTWFAETFCLGGTEAGFSKNAIVSTDFAGLKTTIGSAGILLSPDGLSREGIYPQRYTDRFKEEAIRLLTDEEYRSGWAQKAYDKVQGYTWDKIADRWIEVFEE